MIDEISIILRDLPTTIRAFTVAKDGYFTIVINTKFSNEMQQESYLHELRHIQSGDYDKRCSADLIEMHAHAI